ncbi:MAG: hypothetical protein RL208_393 [Pseudomonadota bacterium]
MQKILLMFSGGLDCCYLLNKLIESETYKTNHITLHHITLKDDTQRYIAEDRQAKKIYNYYLSIIPSEYKKNFNYNTSEFKMNNDNNFHNGINIKYDCEPVAFIASQIAVLDDYDYILTGAFYCGEKEEYPNDYQGFETMIAYANKIKGKNVKPIIYKNFGKIEYHLVKNQQLTFEQKQIIEEHFLKKNKIKEEHDYYIIKNMFLIKRYFYNHIPEFVKENYSSCRNPIVKIDNIQLCGECINCKIKKLF